jgi:hypothetical protein
MFDTLTLAQTGAYVSKSTIAAAAAALPPLSGRYEVILPNRNEGIFFTDSLHEAARHVARARYPEQDRTEEVLGFLAGVEQYGFLRAGEYGVRVNRPLPDGTPWIAKVRGTQTRALPKYAIGDYVEATEEHGTLPSYLKPGRLLRIYGVTAVNDSRPGRQYGYLVGGGGGQRVSEDRLRPVNAVTGELDFDSLSA